MKGIISLNKPSGISSAAAVSKVRRFLGVKAVGHMGTLDPLASGVLLIGVGKACRLFDFFLKKDKRYTAVFEFGSLTDTLDCTGQLTHSGGAIPSSNEIAAILPEFIGKLEQIPPQFSAKSVNGQRAYKIAREGGSVELKPSQIEVFDIKLVDSVTSAAYKFDIHCSSGTYIRSLARDIAGRLGTYGIMTSLVRTTSGRFSLSNSVSLEELEARKADCLIPILDALKEIPRLELDDSYFKQLINGIKIHKDTLLHDENCSEEFMQVYSNPFVLICKGELFGIAEIDSSSYIRITSYLRD